jgi:IS5 family transposase
MVGLAITAGKGLIVGARCLPGTPSDGDTLAEQLEQAQILTGQRPKAAMVDLGYRGREVEGLEILHRGKPKRLTRRQWAWVKRRQAIEPIIGHVKDDCGMRRCRLKGAQGVALYAIACAAGYMRWLLRWITLFCAWLSAALTECISPSRSMSPSTAV